MAIKRINLLHPFIKFLAYINKRNKKKIMFQQNKAEKYFSSIQRRNSNFSIFMFCRLNCRYMLFNDKFMCRG